MKQPTLLSLLLLFMISACEVKEDCETTKSKCLDIATRHLKRGYRELVSMGESGDNTQNSLVRILESAEELKKTERILQKNCPDLYQEYQEDLGLRMLKIIAQESDL